MNKVKWDVRYETYKIQDLRIKDQVKHNFYGNSEVK